MAESKSDDLLKGNNLAEAELSAARDNGFNAYYINRNRSLQVRFSTQTDIVDSNFVVRWHDRLPALDVPLAQACLVTDRKQKQENEALYALLLSKRLPVQLATLNRLRGQEIPSFSNVYAVEIVQISGLMGRQWVVVMERPQGVRLREYLQRNGPLKEEMVRRKLVPQITSALRSLHLLGIGHGRVNLDNIYVTDAGFILGECISEAPGFSQPPIYETLSRVVADAIAKGMPTPRDDYYALGVVVAYAMAGRDFLEEVQPEKIINRKFIVGTYQIMADHVHASVHLYDLLRGLLTDKIKDNWSIEQIDDWERGRSFNLLPPMPQIDSVRPILFNGIDYVNRRLLARDMFLNWSEAKRLVQTDSLVRWAQRGLKDQELSEYIEHIQRGTRKTPSSTTYDTYDDIVVLILLILDPEGPLRVRGVAAHLDGIGTLLAFGYMNDRASVINGVREILAHGLVKELERLVPRISQQEFQAELFALQRAGDLYFKRGIGFGIDRCLYELNPTLPCQSFVMQEEIILNMQEFLELLNRSPDLVADNLLDEHMACFVGHRVELNSQLRIKSLSSFPGLAQNRLLQCMALLHLAQQRSGLKQVSAFCEQLVLKIEEIVFMIHSRTLRRTLSDRLKADARRGSITLLLKALTDPEILVRDHVGFKKATKEYYGLALSIRRLMNRSLVSNAGYRKGLHICLILSFLMASLVFTVLVIKAF